MSFNPIYFYSVHGFDVVVEIKFLVSEVDYQKLQMEIKHIFKFSESLCNRDYPKAWVRHYPLAVLSSCRAPRQDGLMISTKIRRL